MIFGLGSLLEYSGNVKLGALCEAYCAGVNLYRMCPVSYTHLDVYKRQLYLFAPGVNHAFFNNPEPGSRNAHAVVVQFRHQFLGDHFWEKSENIQIRRLLKRSEQGLVSCFRIER